MHIQIKQALFDLTLKKQFPWISRAGLYSKSNYLEPRIGPVT